MNERRFTPLLAMAGAVILTQQGLELLSVTNGAAPATSAGRLGIVAVGWTRGPMLLAADVCLIWAAVQSSSRRMLPALALLHLLLGLGMLIEAPIFLRDAGQMALTIPVPQLTSFRITVVRLLGALVIFGILGLYSGWNLLRLREGNTRAG